MSDSNSRKNWFRQRNIVEMAVLTAVMFGFGFAFAPLYKALCQLTGLNGLDSGMTLKSDVKELPDVNRLITVQFLTVVNGGGKWSIKPEVDQIKVHPGQLYTVNFAAKNLLDQPMVAQAVPQVSPGKAAKYLKKTECFCFKQQAFKPLETKNMPVRFMLEPGVAGDVSTVTLTYTFFDVPPAGVAESTAGKG